ncbi:MAG: NADPH:quinone oxidoreductase family protein [Burkholderiaceae bacterium]
MKAVLCRDYGPIEQLAIEDLPPPSLPAGSVRIAVRAASVNPPDVLMPQGKYQVKPPVPFIPGVECMGTVLELGAGVDDLRVGERVMAYPGVGCYAEQVVAPRSRVERVPPGMDDQAASGFVLVYSTAFHALVDCGRLAAGETLVVLGAAGGIGLCAIQLGKALGATVIAVASTPEKRAICREQGADHLIDSSTENLTERIRALTGGPGADVILDVVGGDVTDRALRAVRPYGRYLIAGYASGVIPMIKGNVVLLKQAQVIGVSYRLLLERDPAQAAANLGALCRLFEQGRLRPLVTAEFPLVRIVDALKEVGERRVIGKVAVMVADGG